MKRCYAICFNNEKLNQFSVSIVFVTKSFKFLLILLAEFYMYVLFLLFTYFSSNHMTAFQPGHCQTCLNAAHYCVLPN